MLWCIFWTVLVTWFVLGMYSVFTTYSFSFNYIGKIFALAFAYGSKYLGLIFGYAVGFIILILLGFLAYLLIRYSKQITDEKIEEKKQQQLKQLQELEDEYDKLAEQRKQEIQQLEAKLNQYIKTEENIENIKQSVQTLFIEVLSRCYSFVSTNESLLEALRAKHIKQLKMALKNGVMNEKEVKKKTERFEKLLEDVKGIIEKEIENYNIFIIKTDDLTRMIEEVKKEYAGQ